MQRKIFHEVLKNQYSVRKVEEIVQMLKSGEDVQSAKKKITTTTQLPEEFNLLKQRLSDLFQVKVTMTCSPKGKGKISIPFANEEELERIINAIDGQRN
jgi:ParB family chromosome partitioning protein